MKNIRKPTGQNEIMKINVKKMIKDKDPTWMYEILGWTDIAKRHKRT